MSRKALGRGLEALIPRGTAAESAVTEAHSNPIERDSVAIERIRQSPWQPRRSLDPIKMEELTRSVRLKGILEPLLLRRTGDGFELVAGERRLRAAQAAGLKDVPAIIVNIDDKESLEIALVENIQREDLNPLDEARAYNLLAQEFGRTHDEIASQVGKDRSTITNLLRLLKLPISVLEEIGKGNLSVGHARVLLILPRSQDQESWARKIVEKGWSVRETERRIAALIAPSETPSQGAGATRDPHLVRVEEAIRRRMGTEVRLHHGRRGGGRLEFVYADQDELERILEILGVEVH